MVLVQIEVQFQDIHSRLAEKAQLPAFRMPGNHRAQSFFADASLTRHPGYLEVSRCGRYVWIQTGCRRCNEIDWHRPSRILRMSRCNAP